MSVLPLEIAAPALPLRPYQSQCLDAIGAAEKRGVRRQLVVIPTGGGKTVCFAHLVTRRPGRALILAHRDELITQAATKLAMVSGSLDIGIVKASQDDTGSRVVVASVQTLARPGRTERLGKFATVIVDEAHHAVASTYMGILDTLGCMGSDGPLTAGFTATAGRSDKVGLGAVWQEITYQRGIVQMIAEGYLCDVRALEIGSDFNLGNAQVRAGDYTDSSLGAELERSDALNAAARAYKEHAPSRQGVAFTPTIATAHLLAAELTRMGIRAEAVDGTMRTEDRRAVLRRLHNGETQVVCNCAVLTEGWDEPAVSCALMLRPTKSAPFFIQMAGRVLRPCIEVGKEDALILDVAGSSALGLATVADLAGLPPGSVKPGKSLLEADEERQAIERGQIAVAAKRTREVQLLKRSDLRWLQSGGAWVLPAGDSAMILVPSGDELWEVWRSPKGSQAVLESGKPLALDWARGVGEEVARAHGGVLSRADAGWRKKRASESQIATLRNLGYPADPEKLTRGDASDMMTVHFAARDIKRMRRTA